MSQRIRIKLKSFDHILVDQSAEKIAKTVKTSVGLGLAVVFVLGITVSVNYLLENYVLNEGALVWLLGEKFINIDLSFLSFIMFIAVIASMVQLVEMIVEKFSPLL